MDYRLTIKQLPESNANGDWLAKFLSKHFFDNQKVEVIFDSAGKPWLIAPSGYHISASNSGDYAAVALSSNPIGVDIEIIKPRTPELLFAITNKNERANIERFGDMAALAAWTAKEAAQKSDHKIYPMTDYQIDIDGNNSNLFNISRQDHDWQGIWKFQNDYVSSLVIRQ